MNTQQLLKSLIEIPSSVSIGTTEIVKFIAEQFNNMPAYETTIVNSNGVSNLIAIKRGIGKTVAFNSHVDTVDFSTYTSYIENDFVYGPGAVNCKGSAVSQLIAASILNDMQLNGTVVFSFVGDEETFGDNGSRYLKDVGLLKPDYLIVGAPTECKIIREERGVVVFDVIAKGKTAHAGNPNLGINAIEKLIKAILLIKEQLNISPTSTVNVGLISTTNTTANVVPDQAECTFDCRFDSINCEKFIEKVTSIVDQTGCSVKFKTTTEPFSTPIDSDIIKSMTNPEFIESIGSSDARHFTECREKIAMGPGDGDLGHTPNEKISYKEVEDCAYMYVDLVKKLLNV